jgi:alcohol dehydrogenase, propanol-preferring
MSTALPGTATGAAGGLASSAMRAVQMVGWQQPPEVREVPRPQPGPGEVVLRVTGAGLCHSDLHLLHWPAGTVPYELPFTLGHEIAGTVAELGEGVDGVEVGESVVVYGPWGCGHCPPCSRGEEHLCERRDLRRGTAPGLGRNGGLAEYVALPARLTVPIGDLDPAHAAPLTDAALNPYHAIKRALPGLPPGSAALVIGVGGLGHAAVQLLRVLSGCRVVAVDRRQEALDLATAAGADAALLSDGLTADDVRRAAGGSRVAFVVDCVGTDATLALSAASVAPGGHLAVLGVGGGTLPFRFGVIPFETTVVFSNWGTRAELAEVVGMARAGLLHLEVERVALDDVPAAYERLEAGEVRGRVVAVPRSEETR